MALCKFFRPVATPQPKRKRLRLMYQHDEEMECLLITSPSSSASLSGSQGSPDLVEAEKSAAVHEDSDLVMKAVMRSISLTDPFTLQLIESPVRGRDCEHVEAFDKRSFLDFNDLMEQNRWCRLTKRWKCPFCDRHIRTKDLVTAADVQEVLDEAKLTHSDATFAVLHPDGRLSLPSSKSLQPAEPAAVDSDEETCPQHQEHEEPRAQVAQPAEKRSCAPETAGNARRSEGDVRSRTSKRGLERASNTPRGKASKKEKKIKKAALAAAKAAWERQNEKQGSILSYCSNAKTGDLAQTLV
ncbi:E3 SUMO-protein ligase pli1 (E3 SUMO-protein transferase plil) [Durusdinium trenchii]|uniref:E3 SUMO-protein ligase pli1 (E3 SUMO-protein transferase plil) n=2 Tax=Durusdinium trenchii TaxID=1381693 RepID=A0ABP0IX94_9DINO